MKVTKEVKPNLKKFVLSSIYNIMIHSTLGISVKPYILKALWMKIIKEVKSNLKKNLFYLVYVIMHSTLDISIQPLREIV